MCIHADAEERSPGSDEAPGASAGRRLDHRMLNRVVHGGVYLYRVTLSPLIGNQCRYLPTCSQYMLDAVDRYGPYRGTWRGLKRILRCNPWGGSGYDPA